VSQAGQDHIKALRSIGASCHPTSIPVVPESTTGIVCSQHHDNRLPGNQLSAIRRLLAKRHGATRIHKFRACISYLTLAAHFWCRSQKINGGVAEAIKLVSNNVLLYLFERWAARTPEKARSAWIFCQCLVGFKGLDIGQTYWRTIFFVDSTAFIPSFQKLFDVGQLC
jgi:hypothetical protein